MITNIIFTCCSPALPLLVSVRLELYIGRLLLCLAVVTVKPVLIIYDHLEHNDRIIRGSLQTSTRYYCQDSWHKFGGDTMDPQFSSRNPSARSLPHIGQVMNGSTSIHPQERAVQFWQRYRALWSWWSALCVRIVNTGLERVIRTSVYGSWFLPRALAQSLPVSPSHFSRDRHKIWCTLVVSFSNLLLNRQTLNSRSK